MKQYMPPHKHVGDKDKPGQIINPVPSHNEKPLEKLIEDYKDAEKVLEKKYWDIRGV